MGHAVHFLASTGLFPAVYLKTSHFSWETVIQTDHSSLHALYPENCIKDLKALMCFDKKGMLFLGASRTVQPTTSLFTDEWLLDVSHLFFRLLWTNKQCRGLNGTCSEKQESIPRGAGGLCLSWPHPAPPTHVKGHVLPEFPLLSVWSSQRAKARAKTFLHLHTHTSLLPLQSLLSKCLLASICTCK